MGKLLDHAREPSRMPHAGRVTPDQFFMDRALDLAWAGVGRTRSNPIVGAVVVNQGRIVGEGFHAAFGFDHAETVALDLAGRDARGATLYATLEPCTHFGKTPPCIRKILESGVRRVVVAVLDPDGRMDGAGVESLRRGGVEVDVGVRAERAILLNLVYFRRVLGHRTTVTLKMAVTLDGRIAAAPGCRTRISGARAQTFVHGLRALHDGVMVGIGTLLVDGPRLDCRDLGDVAVPVPIVVDTHLQYPPAYPWGREGRRFVVLAGPGDSTAAARIEGEGGVVVPCPLEDRRVDLPAGLEKLAGMDVRSILVEGGAGLFTSFIESGRWDAMHVVFSPLLLGERGVALSPRVVAGERIAARVAAVRAIGPDVVASYLKAETLESLAGRLTEPPAERGGR